MHDIKPKLNKAEEVSFSDITKIFILKGKLLGIITAFLSPLVIWLCLQSPRVYQKQLTVAVKLKFFSGVQSSPPSRLSQVGIVQYFLFSNPNEVHAFAFDSLQQLKLAQTTINPVYTNAPQKIDVVLKSTEAEVLSRSSLQIESQLLKEFQLPGQEILAVNRQATELDIEKNKQVSAQLASQINQIGTENPVKQAALEIQLSQQRSTLVALEFDKKYLQQRE